MVDAVHSWRELAPLQTRATLGGVSYTPLRHFNVGTLHLTQSLTKKNNQDEESHGPGIQGMLVLN